MYLFVFFSPNIHKRIFGKVFGYYISINKCHKRNSKKPQTDPQIMKNVIIIIAAFFSLTHSNVLQAQVAETNNFQSFLAQFPSAGLPYCIDAENVKDLQNQAEVLDWEFYEFLPELERSAAYSNTPVYPQPIVKFETDKYFAVLYNVVRGIGKNGKTLNVTVFDKNGNHVATNYVAGMNANSLISANISAALEAEVMEFMLDQETLEMKNHGKVNLNLIVPGNPDEIVVVAE
jgi:hypothetical protein